MKLWIARDKCGYSQLYCERPIKKTDILKQFLILGGIPLVIDYFKT